MEGRKAKTTLAGLKSECERLYRNSVRHLVWYATTSVSPPLYRVTISTIIPLMNAVTTSIPQSST